MATEDNIVTLPNFKVKSVNSDFVVDEVYLKPHLTSIDDALQTYLYVQKENLTTFQLLQILADYFQMDAKDVSASGLKDEQAVTRQLVSIQAVISAEQVNLANNFFRREGLIISICDVIGYGQEPVYPRKLHGNKFSVTLRNVEGAVADKLAAYLVANKFFTLLNYYDEQRFGLPDSIHNTHHIGEQLLADNWPEAYQEYLKSGNEQAERERVKAAFDQTQSHYQALQAVMPSKLDFFISSYNSYLWNQKLNEEIRQSGDTLQVELPYIGVVSLPLDNHTTIPAMLSLAVEQKNWQTGENFARIKTRPAILNIPVYRVGQEADTLHLGNKQAVTVAFYLPTGCYATMLVKQLLLASIRDRFVYK